MLMMIAFIPFPTAVMSENVNFTATAFYTLTMILASLSGLILWWHATRNRHLVNADFDHRQIWREASVPIATIIVFVLSIIVAEFDPSLARICWLVVFPTAFFLRRRAT
jgi:TMEM175 potassium channel family protein